MENCPPCDKGAPRWVTTFGDLMSLLLCFFVLLLSFSEMDQKKYKVVAGSMERAFGVQRIRPVHESPKGSKMIAMDFDQAALSVQIKEQIIKQLHQDFEDIYEMIDEDIEIEAGKHEVTIRLMGESTFDSGKAEIKKELEPLIKEVGSILGETSGDIVVSGHTDDVPVRGGPYKSNLKLSIARAASVAEFLLGNTELDPQRVSTMGFGEHRPIESNLDAEGRRKNRRVEIIVSTIPRRKIDATGF